MLMRTRDREARKSKGRPWWQWHVAVVLCFLLRSIIVHKEMGSSLQRAKPGTSKVLARVRYLDISLNTAGEVLSATSVLCTLAHPSDWISLFMLYAIAVGN